MGIFFLFQAFLRILAIPADFGLRGAVEKRISEGVESGAFLSASIFMKLLTLFVLSILILLTRDYINSYVGGSFAALLIICLFVYEFSYLAIQTLNGELRVGDTATLLLIKDIIWVVLSVSLVLVGMGVVSLIYGVILGHTIVLLWGGYKISTQLDRPSLKHARSLFHYAKFDALSGAGSRIFNWLDLILIGFFLSQTSVGMYEIAWKVAVVPLIFIQSIRTSIFPAISSWNEDNNRAKISQIVKNSTLPAAFFIIPSFFGVLLLSQPILQLLFGDEYSAAWLVLIVFMIQKIVQSFDEIFGRTLQAIDKPDLAAYAMALGVIANVFLNLILIWSFGMIGAAVGTLLSYVIMAAARTAFLSRYIKIEIKSVEIGWCIISSLGMAGWIYLLKKFIVVDSIAILLSIIFSGALVYVSATMMYRPLRGDILGGIRNISS